MALKTYSQAKVREQRDKGNGLWREIYGLIRGKKFPKSFGRVSIPVPFRFGGYAEMSISLTNGFFGEGRLRVFLKNEDDTLGINLDRGFIRPMGDKAFADQLAVYALRVKIFEAIKPVIESLALGPILVDLSNEGRDSHSQKAEPQESGKTPKAKKT